MYNNNKYNTFSDSRSKMIRYVDVTSTPKYNYPKLFSPLSEVSVDVEYLEFF